MSIDYSTKFTVLKLISSKIEELLLIKSNLESKIVENNIKAEHQRSLEDFKITFHKYLDEMTQSLTDPEQKTQLNNFVSKAKAEIFINIPSPTGKFSEHADIHQEKLKTLDKQLTDINEQLNDLKKGIKLLLY